MIAKRFVVSGRVQGVGFRYFVLREARALGVSGWVRNLADGRVEVLVSGERGLVGTLEGRLWQGPPYSLVTEVVGEPVAAADGTGFRVLSTP